MSLTRIARTFFSGLAVVLPIFITIALVVWAIESVESALGGVVKVFLPEGTYRHGLGLLMAIALVFAIGLLMEGVFFRKLMEWFSDQLNRIPLIKTVYGAVRDLMSLFSKTGDRKFSKVVMIKWPGGGVQQIGFVTIEDFTGLPFNPGNGVVAVYIPVSYQIGGYTVFLPREWLTPLDMTLEEAMRFVVTAGMSRS